MRESHQPELRRALEEGVWSDGEPPPHALAARRRHPAARPRADPRLGRGGRALHDHRPPRVDALSPFYVWTTDYAEKRLAWKRRHPLHVILLRTYRIPRPVTVKVRDEYGGCRSWLELTRDLPFEGTPVLSDDEFERASEEIAAIASRPSSRSWSEATDDSPGGRSCGHPICHGLGRVGLAVVPRASRLRLRGRCRPRAARSLERTRDRLEISCSRAPSAS